ncbi:MAG: GFA family protein [Cyanobacteria bacterium P01_D01_bin.73]
MPTPSRFDVCHCKDCRRWHGSPAIGVDAGDVTLLKGEEALRWFSKTSMAERGFCSICGSSLFYRYSSDSNRWSFYMGALDHISDQASLGYHSFRHQKPEFYDITS